ncbi:universal stress protein [Halopenitus persicus]|uniref:Nucleotide-binding universal stress protein, UspA family n=1 Tax=Halopenitus persicus TaxID=1048396 RepID=A0A1H3FVQ6_9EURY|nr:universal stress protein [Halopenitus persicus]QHS16800.1 universal stress protein [haloarchaeon 3A1-DGR]SDX94897.1 Nucleotide-binding universal stress protein, UspA family [Halopenitus persicus]
MYTDVLLATDGSRTAREAMDHAIALATAHDATLHAVYVVETRTAYDNAIVDPETVRENLRREGEAATEAVRSAAGTGLEVVTDVRTGIPHEELLAYVAAEGIDLVVMGSTGRSTMKAVLLGSTASAVVEGAEVPVVLVGDATESEDAGTDAEAEPSGDDDASRPL